MSPQDQKTIISDEESDFKSEKMMKGLSTFISLYAAGMDIGSDLQGVFTQAMRRVQEKTANDMEGEISPGKYKKIYKIWMETYSEAFKEFSKSDHFAFDLGKLNSSLIDFQQNNREMIEENFLKPMNLPTKKEIDEINKELYSLKKTVKELVREIKELKENK
jgi:hypothetical protein